jgi:hypothetical protein
MTSPVGKLWVLLMSNDSNVVNNPVKVPTVGCADVADFIKAVKSEHPANLGQVDASNITLHETEDGPPLKPDNSLPPLNTADRPLYVQAHALTPGNPTAALIPGSPTPIGRPHKRQKLWDDLNSLFVDAGITNKGKGDYAPFSSITWQIVGKLFIKNMKDYKEDVSPIPEDKFEHLVSWLSTIYKCFGGLYWAPSDNETQRVHLIAPIIWTVVSVLNGVTVDVETPICGKRVKVKGKFEFMMKRENKIICIVEAKKDDIGQGLAQDLVGCQVVADLDDSHEVFGIVTTFDHWVFLKSCDDDILSDYSNFLCFDPSSGLPDRVQLANIVGKLHKFLTE